ncbi:NAD(P)/FAD-dependent oxidoreductase [Sphingomonas sp. LY54]|uniref:flavin-containing monooxygenase n=1 Tax=Sphingomonas sp. LY54 TaxID=3095343 RepID=UPI002D7855B7|nr:NAD(P)/FAD-dependent oxidoreductase [Sphingomonas sp. LY54]WRP27713.1 NAD(P)/FAD-dependent oxidoreductase [Sphingomonas sp. LY54]
MAGIYSVYRFRNDGLSVHALEAGSGVGGTWFWNRYPGARCDVESLDYSFSFSDDLQREWKWSEQFAAQPEIRAYLDAVVDRFGLGDHFTFNATVESAAWDTERSLWLVEAAGKSYSAKYLIMATGLLSVPVDPQIPGLERFSGDVLRTAEWPEGVELSGRAVGLFGNGSSGMQVLPAVAEVAKRITLFQRTGAYAVPVRNAPITNEEHEAACATYAARREATRKSAVGTYWSAYFNGEKSVFEVDEAERLREFEKFWDMGGPGFLIAYNDLLTDLKANKLASDFARDQIRSIVKDPVLAEKLQPPSELPLGCKRLAVENGYFDAFNRDNVDLVSLKEEPLISVEPDGIRLEDRFIPLDTIILATGFDAYSGAMLKMRIRGDGVELRDAWAEGPENYLGLGMAGFPNLFTINGANAPASNFFLVTEAQVDWLSGLIAHAEKVGARRIDTAKAGEVEWRRHIEEVAAYVTVTNHCVTWFRGTNIEGRPAKVMNYLAGLNAWNDYAAAVEQEGYRHFSFGMSKEPSTL